MGRGLVGAKSLTESKLGGFAYFCTIGIVFFLWTSIQLSLLLGVNLGLTTSTIIAVIISLFLNLKFSRKLFYSSTSSVPKYILLFGVIFVLIVGSLYFTHILKKDTFGNLLTGESTYGDLPFHLGIVSQISQSRKAPPFNPMFSGKTLVYPYMADFLSATLSISGFTLRQAIIFPGMVMFVVIYLLIIELGFKVLKDWRSALISTSIFFLHGGLGFVYFFSKSSQITNIINFINHPELASDYSHLFTNNIQWANFISRMIVPEMSLFLGIPVGVVIILWSISNFRRFDNLGYVVVMGLTMGMLPLVHTHTFITMSFWLFFVAVFEFRLLNWIKWLKKWLIFGVFLSLTLAPQIVSLINHIGQSNGFFHVKLWWMSGPEGPFVFWIKNLGFFLILPPLVLIVKKSHYWLKVMASFCAFLFLIVNLFQFQPYDWDNAKFLIWYAILASICIGFLINEVWVEKKRLRIFVPIVLVGLTLSGILSLYREMHIKNQLFSNEEAILGKWVIENTKEDSIFLTAPIHNTFAGNLAGRQIFLGYPGLLWVHGINYLDREKTVISIFGNLNNSLPILVQNHINYVVIGPVERHNFKLKEISITNLCLVKSSANYSIYKVDLCMKK